MIYQNCSIAMVAIRFFFFFVVEEGLLLVHNVSKNKEMNETGSRYSHPAHIPQEDYIFASGCDARGSVCGMLCERGY